MNMRAEVFRPQPVFDTELVNAVERIHILPLDIHRSDIVGAEREDAPVHLLDLARDAVALPMKTRSVLACATAPCDTHRHNNAGRMGTPKRFKRFQSGGGFFSFADELHHAHARRTPKHIPDAKTRMKSTRAHVGAALDAARDSGKQWNHQDRDGSAFFFSRP
jgi:hypothetical protein